MHFFKRKKSLSVVHSSGGTTTIRYGVGRSGSIRFSVVTGPAAGPAPEGTDQVDGVADAPLPLAGNVHALLVVVDDQEGGRRQLEVVLLLEVLRRPERLHR